MRATVCIVPYHNHKRFQSILRGVQRADGEFEIIVIDNNESRQVDVPPGVIYRHNKNNLQLAGAYNLAIELTKTEYFIYVCSNHCRFYTKDWLVYMVEEMDRMKDIAMAGTILPHRGQDHVQGGLFIARTKVLKDNPYRKKYPFRFMDVHMSEMLMGRGHKIGTLDKIYSVWSAKDWTKADHLENKKTLRYKAVHGKGAW